MQRDFPTLNDDWKQEIDQHHQVRGSDYSKNELAVAALPAMSRMRDNFPGLYAVALGTGDGMHVCSLGLPDSLSASEISALSASMLSVAEAQGRVQRPDQENAQPGIVTVSRPDNEYVSLVKIDYEPLGHLVLTIFARETQLGMVVYHARQQAREMSQWLSDM